MLARDSHKSVFDGLRLSGSSAVLLPTAVDGRFGVLLGPDVQQIKRLVLEHKHELAAVVLTRPSYQGLLLPASVLRDLTAFCHHHHVAVIVDEAHGAHLSFLSQPEHAGALACGADVVVQSAHKSLHSLTQTALLHLRGRGEGLHQLLQQFPQANELFAQILWLMKRCCSRCTRCSPAPVQVLCCWRPWMPRRRILPVRKENTLYCKLLMLQIQCEKPFIG